MFFLIEHHYKTQSENFETVANFRFIYCSFRVRKVLRKENGTYCSSKNNDKNEKKSVFAFDCA